MCIQSAGGKSNSDAVATSNSKYQQFPQHFLFHQLHQTFPLLSPFDEGSS